jgi:hypothetical protein
MTVFTPPQVAARWKCKPESVRLLIETGRLCGFTISPPGTKRPHWRITLDAVLAYESGAATTPPPNSKRRRQRTAVPGGPF